VINNKKYTSIADLLMDDGFLAWHFKKDHSNDTKWNEWVASNSENAQLANQAAKLLTVFIELKERKLSEYQVNASFDRLFKKIIKKETKHYSIL
jgi:hypothetical protein